MDLWKLWNDYRKEKGKRKYGKIGEQAALTEVSNLAQGNEQIAKQIIIQTIKKDWTGFFSLKQQYGNINNEDLKKEIFDRMASGYGDAETQ